MKIGLILPQTELGGPDSIMQLVRTAEESGVSYLVLYDHVLGADRSSRPDWRYSYDSTTEMHEPLVLLSFIAGQSTLELLTGVLVLPQRQTVLVAQQTAELDILAGGRVQLGVGIGWNQVGFEALGTDFASRAQRFEEQIHLLRRLWVEPSVDFRGRFHTVDRAGLCPRSVQRPVPIWMGGGTRPATLERIGRLSDGWTTYLSPSAEVAGAWKQVRDIASRHGRDVGLQGTIQPGGDHVTPKALGRTTDIAKTVREQVARWREIGATHVSISGLGVGRTCAEHVDFIRVATEAIRAS
ncbi:LLM class F420-dependent oxidoreductase [Candidatus Poriferisocius sp.]|uniref:LLM class F420-dependent oxidoreductase n=1 Tax=Candidatus Poriferisocius sp. TaxID=3101276 RepID=UPI003B017CCB